MFSAMMVSPLFCMSPSPVWLGRFPVPRKFSKDFSRLPDLRAHQFITSGVKENPDPSDLDFLKVCILYD